MSAELLHRATTIADLSGRDIGRRVSVTVHNGGATHVGKLKAVYHYRNTSHVTIRYDSGAEWKPGYGDRLTPETPITILGEGA